MASYRRTPMNGFYTLGELKAFADKIGATDDTVICFERLRDSPDVHDPENHWYTVNADGAFAEVSDDGVSALILINR